MLDALEARGPSASFKEPVRGSALGCTSHVGCRRRSVPARSGARPVGQRGDGRAADTERHDRSDILSGVDLNGTDDVIADVLIDLARQETKPRAKLLSEALILGISEYDVPVNSRPLRAAGFSVLKSPDIPSVLLERGFLSSKRDVENLTDADWRDRTAQGITEALRAWAIADAAAAELVRQ